MNTRDKDPLRFIFIGFAVIFVFILLIGVVLYNLEPLVTMNPALFQFLFYGLIALTLAFLFYCLYKLNKLNK